jgi:hypothetical protein
VVVRRLGGYVGVDCDAHVEIVPCRLGDGGVDKRQITRFNPFLGELARYQQLQRGGGVDTRFDCREPGLVDGRGQLRANDRGRLPPYFR